MGFSRGIYRVTADKATGAVYKNSLHRLLAPSKVIHSAGSRLEIGSVRTPTPVWRNEDEIARRSGHLLAVVSVLTACFQRFRSTPFRRNNSNRRGRFLTKGLLEPIRDPAYLKRFSRPGGCRSLPWCQPWRKARTVMITKATYGESGPGYTFSRKSSQSLTRESVETYMRSTISSAR